MLVDLKPTGQHYMEDLYRVGGLTTILREIKPLLNLDALTITGRTLGAEIDAAPATIKVGTAGTGSPIWSRSTLTTTMPTP